MWEGLEDGWKRACVWAEAGVGVGKLQPGERYEQVVQTTRTILSTSTHCMMKKAYGKKK